MDNATFMPDISKSGVESSEELRCIANVESQTSSARTGSLTMP